MTPFLLEARGLGCDRGGQRILSGVRITLHPGEVVALIGPSGAGKSTLLGCLGGYRRPATGMVRIGTDDLYQDPLRHARRIGFVPQEDIVHLSLTPRLSFHYALKLRRPELSEAGSEARVTEVLRLLELEARADVRTRSLSGGQRKRVSIGVELVASPPILLLDEPTSGLDPALERKTMETLRTLAGRGHTVGTTTHVMESLDLVNHLVILLAGRLVYAGPPATAAGYFGVEDTKEIFDRLKESEPAEWARRFESSPQAATARDRPPPSLEPEPSSSTGSEGASPAVSIPMAAQDPDPDTLLDQLKAEIESESRDR